MKVGGPVGCLTGTQRFDFGEDLNVDSDLRIISFLEVILHHWEMGPKTIHCGIPQKVIDGFGRHLVERLCV